MNLINLTGHPVNVLGSEGETLTSYPSAGVLRAERAQVEVERLSIAGVSVPVYEVRFGRVLLPELAPGTRYVVSRIAAEAIRAQGDSTDDLLIPDGVVRGPDGQPLGCTGFARI